jgi:hypothetical protein
MKRLEAIADSIASLNEYSDPSSTAYGIRNPGMLKAKTLEHLGSANDDCYRIFSCHQAGYKALTDLLRKQCERNGGNTLQMILSDYGHGDQFSARAAVEFIRRSIKESVTEETLLKFFLDYTEQ